jgi:hypothetical protein
MLFRAEFLEGIRSGEITLAFRRWQRPSVRSGGSLLTPVGQLGIGTVEQVARDAITAAEARRAGFLSLQALLDDLDRREDGDIYRIELGPLAPDPRQALRELPAQSAEETDALLARLSRLDTRASAGAWTRRTLEVIEQRPATRAARLAQLVGRELAHFKLDVRKLKALGLTESLEIGYRISPRGQALLALRAADA